MRQEKRRSIDRKPTKPTRLHPLLEQKKGMMREHPCFELRNDTEHRWEKSGRPRMNLIAQEIKGCLFPLSSEPLVFVVQGLLRYELASQQLPWWRLAWWLQREC